MKDYMYIISCTIMCSVFSVLITVHMSLAGLIPVLNSCVRHHQEDGDHFVMLRSDCTRCSSAMVEPGLTTNREIGSENNQLVFMDISYNFVAFSTTLQLMYFVSAASFFLRYMSGDASPWQQNEQSFKKRRNSNCCF